MYLMKGMAVLAMGLVAASCNKLDFDQDAYQRAKEQESKESFMNNVMGGQDIDPNQTWKTTEAEKVTVTSQLSGTLKIYTANPHGNVAAALLTQTIEAGSYEFTVTKPMDAEALYAKLTLNDGSIRVYEIVDGAVEFKNAESTTRSISRRVVKKGVTFPDAPNASDFATEMPSDDVLLPSDYTNVTCTSVHNYKLAETTNAQEIKFWAGNFNLYVEGTKTINWVNPGDGANDMYFYVLPGANLTFAGESFTKNGADRFKMYIASGATVTFEQGTNSCIQMYNKGTVIVKGYQASGVYGNGLIYNEGTMKFQGTGTDNMVVNPPYGNANVSSSLGVWNGTGHFVNAGILEAKGLRVEGSGNFLNLGSANISGYTVVNSNDATWINDGSYTTDDYAYSAGSQNVWNNCKLIVNNLFAIWLGDSDVNAFQMDGGSSVVTKDLKMWGPSRINMGGNSLLKVTNEAQFSCRKANYGIYGPTTGSQYAVFQAKDVISVHNSWESMIYEISYGGQLYVASDSHFANGWSGQYPWYEVGTDVKMYDGQTAAPYTIPANGNCSDGYTGTGGGGNEEPIMYYYYAFEDLGAIGDFDFNDVVLRLSAPNNGQSTVELVAAGGTLPVQVIYNGSEVGDEVHKEFDVDTKTMVNTGASGGEKKAFKSLGTVEIASDANMAALPFGIRVTGNNGETVTVTNEVDHKGTAPLMIVVSGYPSSLNGISTEDVGKWFWAKERVNISSAYSQFGAWGADVSENKTWYYYFTDGKVWTY